MQPGRTPWWAPPEPLDRRAGETLGALCVVSLLLGYLAIVLSQTITFAADEFDADKTAQGFALASVRADVLLALPLVAATDRRGRRRVLLPVIAAACVFTAAGAVSPGLSWLAASQVLARGCVNAGLVITGIIAAEEMPAGARAYGVSVITMVGAVGAGCCIALLFLADTSEEGWRILFAVALLGLPLLRVAGRHLDESRRFQTAHVEAAFAGHGGRFWLLGVSALLLALFTTPATQFTNEFLREDRGFSGARISVFTIFTNIPGALGIIVGGRLADQRGRRGVAAVAVAGGIGATVAMYLATGWPLWAWSVVGAVVGAATIPSLSVYGPELFPTSLRGRTNGVISALGRAGSVAGLVTVGVLADRWEFGQAFLLLAAGPAVVAVLILVAYPETARRSLEDLNPEDRAPDAPRAG